jgi:hypothetical protein
MSYDEKHAAVSAGEAPEYGIPEEVPNGCWLFLDAIEDRFVRMLDGIREFITCGLPQWFMRLLHQVALLTRKLARVAVLALIWAGLTIGPLLVLVNGPGLLVLIGLVWTVCAVIGSSWGLMYVRRRIRRRPCEWNDASAA